MIYYQNNRKTFYIILITNILNFIINMCEFIKRTNIL